MPDVSLLPMTPRAVELEVVLTPATATSADLEKRWRSLEAQSRSSFFLTWGWIGIFLATLPAAAAASARVAWVNDRGRTVAACLLWPRTERRHVFVRSRVLHFNETGEEPFDRVTIEHNGLLAVPGYEDAACAALLRHLATEPGWDELALSALERDVAQRWDAAAAPARLTARARWEKPYFWVDLDAIRSGGSTYLDALSANTRYQIRRSMKLFVQTRGPLRCEVAPDLRTALDWLEKLAVLHQAQWESRGHHGAFGSPFTRDFHRHVVSRSAPEGARLTRVSAGETVIGYLYNLVHDGWVCNYQSGVVSEADAKLKPGLVCHAVAIEDALQRGERSYDFLMGDSRYKASLATHEGTMIWCVVQRNRLALQAEQWLREAVAKRRAAATPVPPQEASA